MSYLCIVKQKKETIMTELTIDTLYKLCKEQREKGNGKKRILISDDDEGNGYHGLFFGFTPTKNPDDELDFFDAAYINKPLQVKEGNINDFVLLG